MSILRKFLTTPENVVSGKTNSHNTIDFQNYVQLLDMLKAAPGFSKVDLRNSALGNV